MMPKETGFTLIELMVVVGIISILAAIAVPSFSVFVYEGRRDAAMAALSELAVKQETFRLGNGTYTVTVGAGGLGSDTSTDDSAYDLAVQPADANCPIATCYIMTATPKGTQTEDSCGVLTYNSSGTRTPLQCWP